MKAIIFDSGPLINLSMNGLLPILEKLKAKFQGKFLITDYVRQEVCDRPSHIPQFELGALRIDELIKTKVLEFPEAMGITNAQIEQETRGLMDKANSSVTTEGEPITIVSNAEISCIALARELKKRKIEVLLAIDERTARLLSERPENLERLMASKLHRRVQVDKSKLAEFAGLNFIRSTELMYVAYKKGLIGISNPKALEALIYATKFKGAAISWQEIDQLKKL